MGPDGVGAEAFAAPGEHGFEIGRRREVPVGDRFVHRGPQPLGRLEFRAVRGLEHEGDALWHGQVLRAVPAGVVQRQEDVALALGADRAGELGQRHLEERPVQAGAQTSQRLARGGLHEGGHVQPLEASVAERDGVLALGRPHPPADRFQAEAMKRVRFIVLGPDLGWHVRVRRLRSLDRAVEAFADFGPALLPPPPPAGTVGVRAGDRSNRFSASQPRAVDAETGRSEGSICPTVACLEAFASWLCTGVQAGIGLCICQGGPRLCPTPFLLHAECVCSATTGVKPSVSRWSSSCRAARPSSAVTATVSS